MSKIYIICIDDQPEVLNALEQDLSEFEELLNIEVCDTGKEALELIESIDSDGDYLGIVISDQVMPGLTGVDVLSELHKDSRFTDTQKILLTGLATHQDTIDAVNAGGLDYYIQKPWSRSMIVDTVKKALTKYILAKGINYEEYLTLLDQDSLYQSLRSQT